MPVSIINKLKMHVRIDQITVLRDVGHGHKMMTRSYGETEMGAEC